MTGTATVLRAKQASRLCGPLESILSDLVARHGQDHRGEVATYIPELGKANPDWFGVVLVTADGAVYEAGDSRVAFTIQSISKPLVYALALDRAGMGEVQRRVGVEPSGEAFNSISLRQGSGAPLNPMINAGAIAISNVIHHACRPDPLGAMLDWFSSFAGRELSIDERVYQSEKETGHRNRAIAHLLRNFDIVRDPVEAALDLYFQQCSILVNCVDLAMMAATLANQGIHPVTRQRVLEPHLVDDVLSVMTTCGMYDYAGQWLYDVGLPAKSGVAGGIMAVLPGCMGIGLFSPRLDAQGNSVRGIAACRELSERYGLHLFAGQRSARNTLRREMTLAHRRSTRVRSPQECRRLLDDGGLVRLLELQGDLHFSGLEVVQRKAWETVEQSHIYLLDLARLDSVHPSAAEGLAHLVRSLREADRQVVMVAAPRRAEIPADLIARCAPTAVYADIDSALEACEEYLLHGRPLGAAEESLTLSEVDISIEAPLELAQMELAEGLSPAELEILDQLSVRLTYPAHQPVFRRGDRPAGIYFLAQGLVSVRLYGPDGASYERLAAFSPGHVFGEMSVVDGNRRSADVWTETPALCHALSLEALDLLTVQYPEIKIKLLQYLLRVLIARLRKANEQIEQVSR